VNLVWLVPVLPFIGFLLNGTLALSGARTKGAVSAIGVGTLLASFAVAVYVVAQLAQAHATAPIVYRYWEWIPVGTLQVSVALQVDPLSAVMLLVVTGVGSLIHIFSVGYMHDDDGYARYFSYLNLFVFFMLTLVLGANFLVTFVGWEGVGLCSYLLIGFWFTEQLNADAGRKAFIMNRIGDFGFLVAMFMIWQHTGSLDYTTVFGQAPTALAPTTEKALIRDAAARAAVDPRFLSALRRAENGGPGREFGVLSVSAPTYEDQVRLAAASIRRSVGRFEATGRAAIDPATGRYTEEFIRFFSNRYAPVGASNDPSGLNQHHARNLIRLYAQAASTDG